MNGGKPPGPATRGPSTPPPHACNFCAPLLPPSACRISKREEFVSPRQRWHSHQQDVLYVIEFKHEARSTTSLHLVEHVRESRLESERLLDFFRAHAGVFTVFQKARTLMFADELDECRRIGLPVC